MKIYLKALNPDEVIRRLLAGEVLRDDDSKTEILGQSKTGQAQRPIIL